MGKIIIGSLKLNLNLEFDTASNKVLIKKLEYSFEPENSKKMTETRRLNKTEVRYKTLMMGARSKFAINLPQGEQIRLRYNGKAMYYTLRI